ncbi:MAG: sporulation protein YqfD [Clostridia bacterium]|nr:sporulation protein YqfD [Clostridia bacterium]
MFFIYLFRYLKGYLRVHFSGDFSERILNLSARNSATLWEIEKGGSGAILANISVKDFRKIRTIRAKSGVRVKIIKKIGAPFIIKKYSKRIGFALGIITFFVIINFLSGYVWKIEVSGNERVNETLILNACSELGINEGTKIKNIDTNKAKEQLLIKLNGLAWASFNIEGCRLTVEVSEIKNNTQNESEPSNLLAKVDGVIRHINVKSGNCLVKVGDAVVKDDMLVSGTIELAESGIISKVKSKGEIIAETERIFTVKVPKKQIKTVTSEKQITKRVLSFFSVKIPLYLGETKKPFICKTELKELKLFNEKIPISITKKIFYPTKEVEINLSDDEAKEIAIQKINAALKNGNFKDFSLIKEGLKSTKDEFILTQTFKCEENIVYEEKIEENILQ